MPFQFVTVGAFARPRNGIVDDDACVFEFFCVTAQIISLQTVINQPLAFAQRGPPTMIGSLAVKRDDFKIRAILERDQRVVTADRMLAARNNVKAQLSVIFRSLIQVVDDDHQMIDSLNHRHEALEITGNYLNRGTISSRNRLSWPVWSHEVILSVICSMPAAK